MSGLVHSTVTDVTSKYIGQWKQSGDENIVANCPFHEQRVGGHKYTLSINTNNGFWLCFSCGARGGLPYLLKLLEVPAVVRDLLIEPIQGDLGKRVQTEINLAKDVFSALYPLPEAMLGLYDYCPPDLVEDGFDPTYLQDHDVGYDLDHRCVTWAVRDLYGVLAGLYRRIPGGRGAKYLAYEHKDLHPSVQPLVQGYTFKKSRHLWNMDRVYPRLYYERGAVVIVCEGFKAGLWCIQHGYEDTVAIMGSMVSRIQLELLKRIGGTVILFLDNDDAGRQGALTAYARLISSCPVHFAMYPHGVHQPDDLSPDDLDRVLENPVSRSEWIQEPANHEAWRAWRKKEHEFQANRTK